MRLTLRFSLLLFCFVVFCDAACRAQESATTPAATTQTSTNSWHREEKSDPLRKLEYSQFVLEGKYLIPPHLTRQKPGRSDAGS